MAPKWLSSIPKERLTIYSLYFLGFMDLLSVSMGLPLLARRARELGATPSMVGLIASVYGGIQFFSSPLMGKYSDFTGRKRILLLCLLGTALGYFSHGLSDSLLMMAVTRIPIGIFKQSQGMCKACLADVTPSSERASVFGKFNAFSSLGFVIGPLVGGHVAMTENGFFKVFAIQSVLFIVMFVFTWVFVEHDDSRQSKTKISKELSPENEIPYVATTRKEGQVTTESDPLLKQTLNNLSDLKEGENKTANKGFFAKMSHLLRVSSLESIFDLLVVRFLAGFAMILFRSSFTTILEFRYNTTPKTNGYIMSFNSMVGGFSGMFAGNVLAFYQHDDAKALLHFSTVLTTAILCVTFSPELWVLIVFIAPLAFSSAVTRVCSTNLTLKKGRADEKGVLLGVGNSLMSFARMIAPTLGGFAQEMSVYGPGLCSVGISSLGILIMATRIVGVGGDEEEKKMN